MNVFSQMIPNEWSEKRDKSATEQHSGSKFEIPVAEDEGIRWEGLRQTVGSLQWAYVKEFQPRQLYS
jgi:hypothetical protein